MSIKIPDNAPDNIELTRSLYLKDEVELMIMNSLLCKKSINEILFWVAEFYYSGYCVELWDILWRCYYDFYAFTNPKLEYTLLKKHCAWNKTRKRKINNVSKSKSIGYIIDFIKTLRICSSTPDIFIFRLQVEKCHSTTKLIKYKGRKPTILSKYDNKYKHFIHSIHKNDKTNIMYYLNNYDPDELYLPMITYFETDKNIQLNKQHSLMIWNKLMYSKKHVLLGIYKMMFQIETNVNSHKIIIKHNKENIAYMQGLRHYKGAPHKFLKTMRHFNINKNIGCFALSRFQVDNLNTAIWYHWEYYAFNNPIWNERFRIYNGVINPNTKEIDFKNETYLEKFYEKYGYEPDEQSQDVHDKAYIPIQKQSISKWLNTIFGMNSSHYINNDNAVNSIIVENILGSTRWKKLKYNK